MNKELNAGLAQMVERGPSKSEANSLQEFKSPTPLQYTTKELNIKITKDTGYEYFIDYEHPLATGNSGRVYNHRHQASIKLGRWIKTDEHVHHKDSNKLNNSLDNLEVLSASEHARIHKNTCPRNEIHCLICNILFIQNTITQRFCSTKCSNAYQVKNKEITKEILNELIPNMSWVALGKMFGYSDNGIKNRAKSLGCIEKDRVVKKEKVIKPIKVYKNVISPTNIEYKITSNISDFVRSCIELQEYDSEVARKGISRIQSGIFLTWRKWKLKES